MIFGWQVGGEAYTKKVQQHYCACVLVEYHWTMFRTVSVFSPVWLKFLGRAVLIIPAQTMLSWEHHLKTKTRFFPHHPLLMCHVADGLITLAMCLCKHESQSPPSHITHCVGRCLLTVHQAAHSARRPSAGPFLLNVGLLLGNSSFLLLATRSCRQKQHLKRN